MIFSDRFRLFFNRLHRNYWPVLMLLQFLPFSLDAQVADRQRMQHVFQSASNDYLSFESKHRRFLSAQHVRLSYLEWGDQEHTDKVIIWLHGSLSNAYELLPFADSLVALGYRVISIDQYYAGKTPRPAFDASFDDLCTDIRVLMDSLDMPSAVIGGFSRGAYLATNFYARYPHRVSGLILEDGGSVPFAAPYLKLNPSELAERLQQVNTPPDIEAKYHGFHRNRFEAYLSLYDSTETGNQFEILSYIKPVGNRWITYRGQSAYYHMQDSLQMAEVLFEPHRVSRYAASIVQIDPQKIFSTLNVPILLLEAASADDPIPVSAENSALARRHPDRITHLVFDNADHNIHYQCPRKFLGAISEFLAAF